MFSFNRYFIKFCSFLKTGWLFCLTASAYAVLLPSIAISLQAQTNATLAKEMVIVVNRNDPDSFSIGQYYARQRGIPESRIVQLSAPIKETITIAEYVETVANPLLNALIENEWVKGVKDRSKDAYGRERLSVSVHKIPFVVLIKGVPLRISHDPLLIEESSANLSPQFRVNNGSVDGEIALLLGLNRQSPHEHHIQGVGLMSIQQEEPVALKRIDGEFGMVAP